MFSLASQEVAVSGRLTSSLPSDGLTMTEAELRKRSEFGQLPIYGEDEVENCRSLEHPNDPDYDGTIREANDDVEYHDLLRDPQYRLAGAIRYFKHEGMPKIRPIFWLRRQ